MDNDSTDAALLTARALVLDDLRAHGIDSAAVVSTLEDALASRRWWADQWPEGAAFVPGLVAQDVQEGLEETGTRWPPCPRHGDHRLHLEPELAEDPRWVCERDAVVVAPLGGLSALSD